MTETKAFPSSRYEEGMYGATGEKPLDHLRAVREPAEEEVVRKTLEFEVKDPGEPENRFCVRGSRVTMHQMSADEAQIRPGRRSHLRV